MSFLWKLLCFFRICMRLRSRWHTAYNQTQEQHERSHDVSIRQGATKEKSHHRNYEQ